MKEYLEVQKHISQRLKKGWQIARLGKSIEKAFKTGDNVVKVSIYDHDGGNLLAVFYYTPVGKTLKNYAQRLGDYLHAQQKFREKTDPWWSDFRDFLNKASHELNLATKGNLLGPPILNSKTGEFDINCEIPYGVDPKHWYSLFQNKGEQIRMEVEYLESVPASIDIELQHVLRWANKSMQPTADASADGDVRSLNELPRIHR
ncbi:hypothetical protein [Kineobactrum salinum]|uniref:Uncharacterized protein n=1 Tax=Kineobactrum salinum TaxID=2708301 RepID=A0A6C0U1R8_9GAMM|nr:hypothetical protein [Kineobactrum salinum]QIB65733.1 hypothetical protein G3T16_10210 [Kineobactrum salinum]